MTEKTTEKAFEKLTNTLMVMLSEQSLKTGKPADELLRDNLKKHGLLQRIPNWVLSRNPVNGPCTIVWVKQKNRLELENEISRNVDASEVTFLFEGGKKLAITANTTWEYVNGFLDCAFQ
jgi:hypothetical protein